MNSSPSRVSVALCTYNGREFVGEQLASILAQTTPPDEIVVCDDRSSDGTDVVVASIAEQHDTVRLISNRERLGIRGNFEQAIGECHGDVIFLSDQDDVWFPHKVASMLGPFADSRVNLVRADAIVVDADLHPQGKTLLERHRRVGGRPRLTPFGVFGSAMAFRGSLRTAALPIPESWPHDVWIAFVASALGEEAVVDEPVQLYRRHEGSSSPARFVDLRLVDRARRDLRDAGRDRYGLSMAMWEAAVARFEALAREAGAPGPRLEEMLGESRAWLELARFRDEITARPRPARVGPVLRALLRGTYRVHGRTLAGAAKDLVVRR